MGVLSKFRKWINRDDGRFYQIGNEPIGVLAAIGALACVGAIVLWQLHDQIGISSAWVIPTGIFGLIIFAFGNRPDTGHDGDDES